MSVDENAKVRVVKVNCIAALKAHIAIWQGRVAQSNFHDHPLWKIDGTPAIDTYIVRSAINPTGTGEMANPPIGPALANAIFAARGKRIRRLPILPDDLAAA